MKNPLCPIPSWPRSRLIAESFYPLYPPSELCHKLDVVVVVECSQILFEFLLFLVFWIWLELSSNSYRRDNRLLLPSNHLFPHIELSWVINLSICFLLVVVVATWISLLVLKVFFSLFWAFVASTKKFELQSNQFCYCCCDFNFMFCLWFLFSYCYWRWKFFFLFFWVGLNFCCKHKQVWLIEQCFCLK